MKMKGRDGKTVVCVGTVTDDVRILEVPKLKVFTSVYEMLCKIRSHFSITIL